MRIRDEEEDDAAIFLAPLIDVVFLLLIFFLVGTVLKEPTKEMFLQMPISRTAEPVTAENKPRIVIGINAQGEIFMNGERATRQEWMTALDYLAKNSPQAHIRLDVDNRAPASALAEVLKALETRGLKQFGLRANAIP